MCERDYGNKSDMDIIEMLEAELAEAKKHIAECMIYRLSALGCRCGYVQEDKNE